MKATQPFANKFLPVTSLLMVALPALLSAGDRFPIFEKAPTLYEAFTYSDVRLTSGDLEEQARKARQFYLDLPEDNLLNGFRKRAGLPAPGKPMGGWYDPDGFAGAHPFGQYVSALARMYASTHDPRFKAKVARLVHGFHQTIAPDGFFYSSAKVAKEWPCYLYDKNCIGMRDAYTFTGNTEALKVLSRMTDWAVLNLPTRSDEWYTLPENLYSCYALTGEKRYLDLASKYDYSAGFYNDFAAGKNAFHSNLHAYSHINTLCSAAKIYEATGDPKYYHALQNAFNFLTKTQMVASGGWGPDEHFSEEGKGKLLDLISSTSQGFETPCGTYANVNVDRYMFRFNGEAKYGDNMERVLYNGMLASLTPQSDGHTFYYSDYRPGAKKVRRDELWTCCSGTYAQATADYPLNIYFHDDASLVVNLFVPSETNWKVNGNVVKVAQTTSYPARFDTEVAVNPTKPINFKLKVRVPAWSYSQPVVSLNGKRIETESDGKGFVTVERTWNRGDKVHVTFQTAPRFEPIDPLTPNVVAVMVGPLLYVALSDGKVNLPGSAIADGKPRLTLDSNGDLTTTRRDVVFRPFYRVLDERYTTYCSIPSTSK